MIFRHGVIQCDFHPGNILISRSGQLVLLDFGYMHFLDNNSQRQLAELFLAMVSNDSAAGVDVIMRAADRVPPDLDAHRFQETVAKLFAEIFNLTAEQFDLTSFVVRLFGIQAEFGILSSPSFTMPILALLAYEGSLKDWYPEIDFQRESVPYILEAIANESTPHPRSVVYPA